MAFNPDEDIPRLARQFLSEVQQHEQSLRKDIKERLEMYVGGKLQWDVQERNRRDANHRPYISINECKPPVDQVETDIRLNPPGPVCHPVGGGADDDTADVIAGAFRQIEYASDAKGAYVTSGKHCGISGYGVIEYGTRYVDNLTNEQELYVINNEDPCMWYFDPLAKLATREDSMVALKGPMVLSRAAYELAYGKNHKVLKKNYAREWTGNAQTMFGWDSMNFATINTWTSGGDGPFWVAVFWRVKVESEKSRLYTDLVWRKDSDLKAKPLPESVVVKTDADGDDSDYVRDVAIRKVYKYVVDACEVLDKTEWIGDYIPALTVLGPEIYIDGVLHRGSLVQGMIDPQRALNYTATSMMEVAGKVPRAPFIGTKGQFDDIGDDGRNKWATATTEDHAWLAAEPVSMVDEATGRTTFAPLPQRNMMEASIQWCLQLAQFFKDAIQAASSYSATSLGKRTADQSGEAIRALQAESSKGTFSIPDTVNNTVAAMYRQWLLIYPRITDSARAQTIIRADGKNEQALINQYFDDPNGQKDESGKAKQKIHDVRLGRYSVRVDAGPSPETRNQAALQPLGEVFKNAPELLQIPGVAAGYVRLIGDGNPKVEQIADLLPGGADDQQNPAAVQQQNQQLQGQLKTLGMALQQANTKLATQQPKIDADERKSIRETATKLAIAEITAKSQDSARASADALAIDEQHKEMAHDVALQADQQEHQSGMADQANAAALQQQQAAPYADQST